MLKAVLFDDENIVLEALSVLVDWKRLGIELAGTAGDGISALELIRRVKPDIVLTDIRMPGLDGFQLIEAIMREVPDTCCIVFSGFNEFEYVKRAIQLGVSGYVEKPITEESIEQALGKGLDLIDKRNKMRLLEQKWESSKRELLEKATWELLQNGNQGLARWEALANFDDKSLAGVTVLVSLEPLVLPEQTKDLVVSLRNGPDYVNVIFHAVQPDREYWDFTVSMSDNAERPVGIGNTYASAEEAPLSYEEAQRALKTSLFLQLKGAVQYGEIGNFNKKQDSIELARKYIELRFSSNVSLQEVAEHVGLNPTYFSMLFKEVTGESYIKYLTRHRMELAKLLLRGGMRVNEVSEKVGYLTHRHFAEVFRKYTGLNPGQYKEAQAEKNVPLSEE